MCSVIPVRDRLALDAGELCAEYWPLDELPWTGFVSNSTANRTVVRHAPVCRVPAEVPQLTCAYHSAKIPPSHLSSINVCPNNTIESCYQYGGHGVSNADVLVYVTVDQPHPACTTVRACLLTTVRIRKPTCINCFHAGYFIKDTLSFTGSRICWSLPPRPARPSCCWRGEPLSELS